MNRKLRMGMVGGGKNAFIGAVHRIAANLDGLTELACGCFSSDPATSLQSGKNLFLPESRIYSSYADMFKAESLLDKNVRMDFVTIVTPNNVHFEPVMMALDAGFHVVIDKPISFTTAEAILIQKKVTQTGLLLCLTHTYTGYPLVKHARKLVADGELGPVRKIYVEYPQGWLSRPEENGNNKQASWRTDPARSGKSGCMGDIGTHAAHLAEYISGLHIIKLCADLNKVVHGRQLDDDGAVLLKFENGASGVLIASQVAAGEENPLTIRVYGTKGGLEWSQMEPNTLIMKWLDQPTQLLRTGGPGLSEAAHLNTRTPGGHPEGYLEAFANLYRNFCLKLSSVIDGGPEPSVYQDFPDAEDGVRGMAFIDRVVESGNSTVKWTDFKIE